MTAGKLNAIALQSFTKFDELWFLLFIQTFLVYNSPPIWKQKPENCFILIFLPSSSFRFVRSLCLWFRMWMTKIKWFVLTFGGSEDSQIQFEQKHFDICQVWKIRRNKSQRMNEEVKTKPKTVCSLEIIFYFIFNGNDVWVDEMKIKNDI